MKLQTKELIEYTGIITLVISLAFVGYEIRQNTNVARSEAYQQFNLAAASHDLETATDERLNNIRAKLTDGLSPEDLKTDEQLTLASYYNSVVRIWAGLYYSAQEGIVPGSAISGAGQAGVFSQPAFRLVWPALRPQYDEGFAEFVELQIQRSVAHE
jgi:hypothetical protein